MKTVLTTTSDPVNLDPSGKASASLRIRFVDDEARGLRSASLEAFNPFASSPVSLTLCTVEAMSEEQFRDARARPKEFIARVLTFMANDAFGKAWSEKT